MGSCASVQTNPTLSGMHGAHEQSASQSSMQSSLFDQTIFKEIVESEKKRSMELTQDKEDLKMQLNKAQKSEEYWKAQQILTKEQLSDASKKLEEVRKREEALIREHLLSASLLQQQQRQQQQQQQQSATQNSVQSAANVRQFIGANPHESIKKIVDLFLQRQNKDFVARVFEDNCKSLANGVRGMGREEIKNALQQLGLNHQSLGFDSMDNLESELDLDNDNLMTYEEFVHVLQRPSKIEGWTSSIPWTQMVATVINAIEDIASDKDPLHKLSMMNGDEEKLAMIFGGISYGVQILLTEQIQELKRALGELESNSTNRNSDRNRNPERNRTTESGKSWTKFSSTSEMQCGIVSNFYEGLSSRVGEVLIYGLHVPR
jgi:hypothetical protein